MNKEIQIVYYLLPTPTLLYKPITDLPLHHPTYDSSKQHALENSSAVSINKKTYYKEMADAWLLSSIIERKMGK